MASGEGAGRPLELLEREISELAAHIHAATCRWLMLVGEYDRREGWAQWGCKSCAQWLSWQCSLAPSAAREQVRVARRMAGLPLITAAFGRGELSYSQVRAMSRVATPEVEESMLELARFSTAAQLERMLRGYHGVVERELTPDERTHGGAYLVCEHDEDGSLLLRGRLPAARRVRSYWLRSRRRGTACALSRRPTPRSRRLLSRTPRVPQTGIEALPRKRLRPMRRRSC